jgi:hypothetical protein
MKFIKSILLFTALIVFSLPIYAKVPIFQENKTITKPHRIIRTCCMFGSDVHFFAVPGVGLTEITSLEKIGNHHYLGKSSEENGIIYTRRGGFIDMGHMRDQIDWTAYLYAQLKENKSTGRFSMLIGHEGGKKNLNVEIPSHFTTTDLALLSGKIAYDFSVWHEIATWFGASSIPFVPERYSSFSIEDAYSNLLGATIGIEAVQSDLPYEEAVTKIINRTLKDLEVVPSELETYMAMEAVRDVWWTRDKRLPSAKILIKRQVQVYPCLQPWLVPGWESLNKEVAELKVPDNASTGETLNSLYKLEYKLNYNFPVKKLFPDRKDKIIDQNDFPRLLAEVSTELNKKESKLR